MARSDDSTNRKRGPAEKDAAPAKKPARAKAAPKAKPATPAVAAGRKPPKPAASPRVKTGAKPKKAAPAKTAARPAAKAPAPRARKAAEAAPAAPRKAKAPAASPRPRRAPRPGGAAIEPPRAPVAGSEEEQIEAAKYLPRELPRLFEEERFIFPESYGQSRIRLLVKDPEWLFAHWDVDPQSLARVRQELGERASALSRLTLRVTDPHNGGENRVLLPEGARSWYVRADRAERSYQAQLGLTLPSGEFRSLAESNTVRTPRSGPSAEGAPRRARYDGSTLAEGASSSSSSPAAEPRDSAPPAAGPGPWRPDPATAGYPGTLAGASPSPSEAGRGRGPGEAPGGASDVYRR
jgi:Domain of unknown function (DUF4912)